LRWQAERDIALGAANQPIVHHLAKAPSPLRFAGAIHDAVWQASDQATTLCCFSRTNPNVPMLIETAILKR
jgi:hypothetical protein